MTCANALKSPRSLSLQIVFSLCTLASAGDGLLSNFTFSVHPGRTPGLLWVVTRGEAGNGTSRLYLEESAGSVQLSSVESNRFPDEWVAVQDGFFADLTGELRRLPALLDGDGLWVPGYRTLEGNLTPVGLLRPGTGTGEAASVSWDLALDPPMSAALHGLARSGHHLWLALGQAGLGRVVLDSTGRVPSDFNIQLQRPHRDSLGWVSLPSCANSAPCADLAPALDSLDTLKQPAVLALEVDTIAQRWWVGTDRGLWVGIPDSAALDPVMHPFLDTARITGIWRSESQLLVESGVRRGSRTESRLYFSTNAGASFAPVDFGTPASPQVYDSLDATISGVAFLGDRAWVGLLRVEGNRNGLLLLEGGRALEVPDSLRQGSDATQRFVHGPGAGILEYDAPVTGATAFDLGGGRRGLALSLYGAGVSVSADSGRTWRTLLNQAPVKGGLEEVRITPSVMRFAGTEARISYRLDKPARVTIEVFSYDMERVRTIVAGVDRPADPVRSSHPREDVWNGTDAQGRSVAAGLYYIRVRTSGGLNAWGKVYWGGSR